MGLPLKKRVLFIQKTLEELYPRPEVPLSHTSRFELLIAVLLSAQCTDKTVNKVTPDLFAKAKTPEKMARLNLTTLKSIVKPCGLYLQKAFAIKKLSQILLQEYGGEVPDNMTALEKLPGVGHKTASVVMVQGFGIPAFPVDTHIHRLASRWELSNGKNVKKTEEDLKNLFPSKIWGKLHLQMIFYGREYCPARGHVIENCPICYTLQKNLR